MKTRDANIKIEISQKTIFFTIAVILGLYFLYLIQDIILLIFISFMISVAISPLVKKIQKLKVPESWAMAIAYCIVVAGLAGIIAGVVPPLVSETAKLINQIPIPTPLADKLKNLELDLQDINVIAGQLNSLPSVFGLLGSAFEILIITVTVGFLSFYLLKEHANIHRYIHWFFGTNQTERQARAFVENIENKIGSWLRGKFLLMTIVGGVTYLGLTLLNISYAVPLAILAGLLEILPNIGPTVSAIPAVAIALVTASPTMAVAVIALYVLIQQLENALLSPMVMRHTVGINPILTIVLILIGYRLAEVGGSILAIPIFLTLKVVLREYLRLKSSGKNPNY